MKKENVIVSLIILVIVVGYFIFLTVTQMEEEDNVFLSRSAVGIESLANPVSDSEKVVLRYKDRNFTFRDLPLSIQKRIKNEQLASHKKTQLILKDFLVRFHKGVKIEKDVNKVQVEKLPALSEISNDRVDDKEVEELYKLNKDRLPSDHDPLDIKRQIKVELLAKDAYEYVLSLLTDMHKTTNVIIPAAPQIPEEWLVFKDLSPSYGSPQAPNHLIWISDYACKDCDNYTVDMGLLLQKYSKKELRITFIPWSENDIDNRSFINMAGMCLYKTTNRDTFWRFHSQAMTASKKLAKSKRDDIDKARAYLDKVLKATELEEETVSQVKKCAN